MNTFPKRKISDGLSLQASAIKDAYEVSGLQVRIVGLICDFAHTTTLTRYYRAFRISDSPADMEWEIQAVHLVPWARLEAWLANGYDQIVLAALCTSKYVSH